MSTVKKHEIAVEPRTLQGKGNARRLRKEGRIPGIIYSNGAVGTMVSIDAGDWAALTHHDVNLVYLNMKDRTIAAVIKEVQVNYLKNHVLHVDFKEVDLNAETTVSVNIHLVGEAAGVNHGGVLEQLVHHIDITGKPADLPEFLEVSVSDLEIGDAVTASQLPLPAGITLSADPEEVICHVIAEKEEVEEEPADTEAAAEPEVIEKAKDKDKDKEE